MPPKLSNLLREMAQRLPTERAVLLATANRLDALQKAVVEKELAEWQALQRLFDSPLPPLEKPDPITIHDLHYIGLTISDVKIKRNLPLTWER